MSTSEMIQDSDRVLDETCFQFETSEMIVDEMCFQFEKVMIITPGNQETASENSEAYSRGCGAITHFFHRPVTLIDWPCCEQDTATLNYCSSLNPNSDPTTPLTPLETDSISSRQQTTEYNDIFLRVLPETPGIQNDEASTSFRRILIGILECLSITSSEEKENIIRKYSAKKWLTTASNVSSFTPIELFNEKGGSHVFPRLDASKLEEKSGIGTIINALKCGGPETFSVRLLYRLFTIGELSSANVYGRCFINGQRYPRLDAKKVRTIRRVTTETFSNVEFSWRNCVLAMNKAIQRFQRNGIL